jgi:hypothetical protein
MSRSLRSYLSGASQARAATDRMQLPSIKVVATRRRWLLQRCMVGSKTSATPQIGFASFKPTKLSPHSNASRDNRIEPIEKPETLPLHEQAKAEDPSFQTPDETASRDEAIQEIIAVDTKPSKAPDNKPSLLRKLNLSWPPTRKQQIIGGALAVVLAFGIGAGWTLTHHKRTVTAVVPKQTTSCKTDPYLQHPDWHTHG